MPQEEFPIQNEIRLSYKYLRISGFDKPENALNQKVTIAYKNVEVSSRKENMMSLEYFNSITGALIRVNLTELEEASKWQLQGDPGASALIATTDPNLPKDKFEKVKKDLREKDCIG